MAGEAPVYRSSQLHTINPTAAINEDTSYLWTLVGAAHQRVIAAHCSCQAARQQATPAHRGCASLPVGSSFANLRCLR